MSTPEFIGGEYAEQNNDDVEVSEEDNPTLCGSFFCKGNVSCCVWWAGCLFPCCLVGSTMKMRNAAMIVRRKPMNIKKPFEGCGGPCVGYCGLAYLFSSLGSAVWAASLLADDNEKCCMPDKGCCNVYCQFQWCAPCAACKFYAKEVTRIKLSENKSNMNEPMLKRPPQIDSMLRRSSKK
jgi:hypothetical protein